LLIISENVFKAGGPGFSRMRRFVTSSASRRPGRLQFSCLYVFDFFNVSIVKNSLAS